MQIAFKYIYPNLYRVDTQSIPSGAVGSVSVAFRLTGVEDGDVAKGVFMRDGKAWHVVLNEGECTLPYEVCTHAGHFLCGVIIERGDTIETSTLCSVHVTQGPATEGDNPGTPTQTELEQLYSLISRLGSRLIGIQDTQGLDKLCEAIGVNHLFVWLGDKSTYHDVTLEGGGVYGIIKDEDGNITVTHLYSLCGPEGPRGQTGETGPQGECGVRFGNFADAMDLAMWSAEVTSGSACGLATADFTLVSEGNTVKVCKGDIVRYEGGTYSVLFNILSQSSWSLAASDTLEDEVATISCDKPTSPAVGYLVFAYIPPDEGIRHVECTLGSQSIGKLTNIPCTTSCMLRIKCACNGIWTEDITYYNVSAYTDFDQYRTSNIQYSTAQKFYHFCGKNNVTGPSSAVFNFKSSVAFPVGTRYEIWIETK